MPAPRHLAERAVLVAMGEHRDWGPKQIRNYLQAEQLKAIEQGYAVPNLPTEKTISRIKQRASAAELAEYGLVRWPESFGVPGGLSWELAPAVIELLRDNRERDIERPTLSYARWFAHVTASAPARPLESRRMWAAWLTLADAGFNTESNRRTAEAALIGESGSFSADLDFDRLGEFFAAMVQGGFYRRLPDGVLERRRQARRTLTDASQRPQEQKEENSDAPDE